MYLTGFADEAADGIDGQIRATRELGWRNIESRKIDGANIHDIDDAAFDTVCEKLAESGVKINCFGSAIANWGKQINESFESSLAETRRAIPRMQRLGTKLVRIMSFAVLSDREPHDQLFEQRVRRLRELVKMFSDAGIQAVHENCMNYGGLGPKFTLELLEAVPGLKLVFDTANPIFSPDAEKPRPWPRQSSWEFYRQVREHIAYLHIKDARYLGPAEDGGLYGRMEYTWPGEGEGDVKRIVKDLLDNGYEGGISMEPHLAVVFHDENVTSSDEIRFQNYVEYGRRFMKLLEEIGYPYTGE